MFVMSLFFFILFTYVLIYFSVVQDFFWSLKCLLFVFAALLLNPHEHVCKYRPLKAQTQNTNM